MPSVAANGITIEYDDVGDGEPLLLVMGLSGQLIDWPEPFVQQLVDEGFRVIRLDNRDAGLSTEMSWPPPTVGQLFKAIALRRRLRAEYDLSDMAADAVGLLDALGIERAHLCGMSMGGMIVQTIAIDHPGRVSSLTSIMSTTGNRKVGQPRARLARFLRRRGKVDRETAIESSVELFRAISGPTFDDRDFLPLAEASIARSFRPEGTARQMAAILASPDRTPGLRRLTVPTLVIHGAVDPLVRPSGGVATASAIPGARLLMFPDMGHDLPKTRWQEMAEEIARNARRSVPALA